MMLGAGGQEGSASRPLSRTYHKPCAGRLVVGWVTTSESLLLIVLLFSDSTLSNPLL